MPCAPCLSTSRLPALIDGAWCAFAGDRKAVLAVQEPRSNLRSNLARIGPAAGTSCTLGRRTHSRACSGRCA